MKLIEFMLGVDRFDSVIEWQVPMRWDDPWTTAGADLKTQCVTSRVFHEVRSTGMDEGRERLHGHAERSAERSELV